MREILRHARFILEGNRGLFVLVLAVATLFHVTFTVVDPLILKALVDRGLVDRDFRAFAVLAAAVLAFGVLVRIALWGSELLSQILRNRVTERLSQRLLKAYYRLDFSQVQKGEQGYFLSRIYDEPAKLAQGIVGGWIGIVTKSLIFVAAASVSLFLSWRITLMLSALVPILYFLAHRFAPAIKSASKAENEEEAKLRDALGHSVGAYTTVKMFGLQPQVERTTRRQTRSYLNVLFSRVKSSQTYALASNVSLSLAEAAVLVAAGWGVVRGDLTIGGLFGFMNAYWKVINAATGIIGLVPELSKLNGYAERLQEFEAAGVPEDDHDHSRIELKGVTAGYDDQRVLEEFDLTLELGERVLVLGPNGSGKSTLALLLSRFLEPLEGSSRTPHRRRVSAMLDPFHFIPGSLKDNVGFDRLDEEHRQLFWELVQELGLEDKVDKAPAELSQGQRKKVQILMTLLKDADVYLYDEPLANLDGDSKERIFRLQLERARNKTLVCILHGDAELYSEFDRVVFLEPLGERAELGEWVEKSA